MTEASFWVPSQGFLNNLAREMLQKWLPQGADPAGVYDALYAQGYGIAPERFYDMARHQQARFQIEQQIVGQPQQELVPKAWHDVTDWRTSTDFLYHVRVFGVDATTGEEAETTFWLGSNDQLSPDEVRAKAQALGVAGESFNMLDIRGMQVYDAIRRQ
jgi:hypothetical protein